MPACMRCEEVQSNPKQMPLGRSTRQATLQFDSILQEAVSSTQDCLDGTQELALERLGQMGVPGILYMAIALGFQQARGGEGLFSKEQSGGVEAVSVKPTSDGAGVYRLLPAGSFQEPCSLPIGTGELVEADTETMVAVSIPNMDAMDACVAEATHGKKSGQEGVMPEQNSKSAPEGAKHQEVAMDLPSDTACATERGTDRDSVFANGDLFTLKNRSAPSVRAGAVKDADPRSAAENPSKFDVSSFSAGTSKEQGTVESGGDLGLPPASGKNYTLKPSSGDPEARWLKSNGESTWAIHQRVEGTADSRLSKGAADVHRTVIDTVVDRTVAEVKLLHSQDSHSVEIDLKPEALGRISLRVSLENGVVTARITGSNPAVIEALEANSHRFYLALRSQGVEVENFTFAYDGFGSGSGRSGADAREGFRGNSRFHSGQNVSGIPYLSLDAPRSGVDTYFGPAASRLDAWA